MEYISMAKQNNLKSHPDHSTLVPRIKRAIGQLEAVERMINDRRYCPDIIQQLRAVQSAAKAVELEVLKTHLANCIKDSTKSNNPQDFDKKLKELLNLIKH